MNALIEAAKHVEIVQLDYTAPDGIVFKSIWTVEVAGECIYTRPFTDKGASEIRRAYHRLVRWVAKTPDWRNRREEVYDFSQKWRKLAS